MFLEYDKEGVAKVTNCIK